MHTAGMTQWFRDHWAGEEVWRYFELDDDGFVQRHVELEGPDRAANAACSLQELEDAIRAGTIDHYYETYGGLHEWSFAGGDHDDPQPSTEAEFEGVWKYARRACEAGSRSRPDPGS
jgi:hypothetical protein